MVNFSHVLPCFGADVISNVLFGRDLGSLSRPDSEEAAIVNRFFTVLSSRIWAPFEWWKLPLIGRLHNGQTASDELSNLMSRLIDESKQSDCKGTLLSKLMDSEGRKLTYDEVVGNLKTLFLAGTDTTSTSLAWCFYGLAQQPHLQEMIAEELAAKAPDHVTSIQNLEQLHYVRAVWAETLRLRSVAPYLMFNNAERLMLAGRPVLPGTEILVLTRYVENTLPEIQALGGDLHEYRPERWLADGTFKRPSDSAAFGQGSRMCLGRRLADLEGQLAIAEVVRNFRLSDGPAVVGELTNFTQSPDQDIKLFVAPRMADGGGFVTDKEACVRMASMSNVQEGARAENQLVTES
jgi:cytochrome P450